MHQPRFHVRTRTTGIPGQQQYNSSSGGGVGESTGDNLNGHQTHLRFFPLTFVVYPGGIVDEMIADDMSTKTLRFGGGGCSLESAPRAGAPGARLGDTRPDDSHRGVGQHRLSRQGRLHSCLECKFWR